MRKEQLERELFDAHAFRCVAETRTTEMGKRIQMLENKLKAVSLLLEQLGKLLMEEAL